MITCLKLAAVMGWELMKVDIGWCILCTDIDEDEEVHMLLVKMMSEMCAVDVERFLRSGGKIAVRVDKATYGQI